MPSMWSHDENKNLKIQPIIRTLGTRREVTMTSLVAQRFLWLCHSEYLSTNLEAKLSVTYFKKKEQAFQIWWPFSNDKWLSGVYCLADIFWKKKKKSCTFNLSLQGRGDILTTHKRVIAYQKKVMLWKEHLEECMFGSICHYYALLLPKWCLFLTKIFIFVHSKTWKENVLLLKTSPKGKFLWNLETLLRLWKCNTFHFICEKNKTTCEIIGNV